MDKKKSKESRMAKALSGQRRKKKLRRLILLGALILIVFPFLVFVFIFRPYSFGDPPSIPPGWGMHLTEDFYGEPATPKPLSWPDKPNHPFLAATNSSNMHVDAFASDVHPWGGVLGIDPKVISYAHGAVGGECACVTFDQRGNIVAVCATFKNFSLMLIDPGTLKPLARFYLPPRASNKTMNLRKIMSDTSGGAYFFLDHEDNAVLIDAHQRLKVIGQKWDGDSVSFELRKDYDLTPVLREHTDEMDVFTSVLPDWDGRYWFVSRRGIIGVMERETGDMRAIHLNGEEIQNSFALDQQGVYVVSDVAFYALKYNRDSGLPSVVWREEYERATADKPGSLTRGSGTTPTLVGEHYVAIADNATPRINVLVYRRDLTPVEKRLVAKVPVFQAGQSATENSLIGFGNSLIIENNYGYDFFPTMMFGRSGAGGVARVDFDEATGTGRVVWTNPIVSQTTVPKLSMDTGLVYVYAKDTEVGWGVDAYYLAAIDFETGKTVFRIKTGTGVSYDNNWAPITLGPDRSAYVGVLRGLVKVFDREETR